MIVPFEDGTGSKRRPVAVIGALDTDLVGVASYSKEHRLRSAEEIRNFRFDYERMLRFPEAILHEGPFTVLSESESSDLLEVIKDSPRVWHRISGK